MIQPIYEFVPASIKPTGIRDLPDATVDDMIRRLDVEIPIRQSERAHLVRERKRRKRAGVWSR